MLGLAAAVALGIAGSAEAAAVPTNITSSLPSSSCRWAPAHSSASNSAPSTA